MQEATHPGFAGAIRMTAEPLPESTELATAVTIQRMDQYTREDAGSAAIAAAVDEAAHPLMRHTSHVAALQLIFQWVKRRIAFRTDARNAAAIAPAPPEPWTAELLIRPVDLLRMSPATGDCDDFSMLTAAMLLRAGFGAAFVTIAADPEHPDAWSHVYALAIDPTTGEQIAMDTSHGSAPGWEYPEHTRRKVWMIQEPEPMQQRPTLGTTDGSTTTLPFPWATGDPGATPQLGLWQQLALIGASTGAAIAKSRYAVAPPGTYQQTGPNGATFYRQNENGSFQFPTIGIGSSEGLGTMLAIAGVVVVGALIFSRR